MLFKTRDKPDHHIANGDIDIKFRDGIYSTSNADEIELLKKHHLIEIEMGFGNDSQNTSIKLSSMKKAELVAIAESLSIDSNGTCGELIDRINEHIAVEGEINEK